MFKHLLVPLDGSGLAESALPVAAALAERLGASVTLIHVIEHNAPKEVHSEHHLADVEEAQAYLTEVARRAFPVGVPVDQHIHTTEVSDVARSIVEHAGEITHDLIVMCTHGRSGPRDWLYGSIAQQVIASGNIPVLLVRPGKEEAGAPFPCRKLLVPVDGVVDHEQGILVAVGLAQACREGQRSGPTAAPETSVHLLMVVPNYENLKGDQAISSRLQPGATSALLDIAEESGEQYLRGLLEKLQEYGVHITAEIARGDPIQIIVETLDRVNADLIVLGTHGKTGLDAFWSGSLTPRLSTHIHVPLLLVPVSEIAFQSQKLD